MLIMTQTKKLTSTRKNITIEEYNLENVGNFICIGVQLMKDGNEVDKIKSSNQLSNKAFYSVLPISKASCAYGETRFPEHEMIIRPALKWRCEIWTSTQTSEKLVNSFERRVLRKIIEANRKGFQSRIRYIYKYEIFDHLKEILTRQSPSPKTRRQKKISEKKNQLVALIESRLLKVKADKNVGAPKEKVGKQRRVGPAAMRKCSRKCCKSTTRVSIVYSQCEENDETTLHFICSCPVSSDLRQNQNLLSLLTKFSFDAKIDEAELPSVIFCKLKKICRNNLAQNSDNQETSAYNQCLLPFQICMSSQGRKVALSKLEERKPL